MEKAILLKEWIKTRRVFAMALMLTGAMTAYVILMMNRLIELKGIDHLWLIMLLKDNSFIDLLKYLPLTIGLAIGIAQMVPEMSQKRLKLTLHLPYPQLRLIALMLVSGLMELFVIYLLQVMALWIYDMTILPPELVGRVLLTTVPWYMAGFSAYLFSTAVCLEGTWHMRTIIILLGLAVSLIFFLQPALEAYNGMIWIMLAFVCLLTILSFGSVMRFKEGRQD
ncbi:MAG: hypothetical protein K2M65_05315 [Muribaculaceae bacterium]|nr:hypothetical protein [Muribaculaceae bacterium]